MNILNGLRFESCDGGHAAAELDLDGLFETYSDFTGPQHEIAQLADATIRYLQAKSVLVYGAGNAGEHFYSVLTGAGVRPACFFDRKADSIKAICGISVKDPDELKPMVTPDCVVVVAVNGIQMAADIQRSLHGMGLNIPIFNGRHLIRILNYPICAKMHNEQRVFDVLKCIQCGVDVKKCSLFTECLKRESNFRATDAVGSRKFDWCGYILGQKCTLNCECCCESIPYLRNGGFVDAAEAVADIRKLADACEFLERLELVGGEPLLHPQLREIIEESLSIRKVGYIYIFTNGTVVPDDAVCSAMSNSRVLVHISNYTHQWVERRRQRLDALRRKFTRHGVKHFLVNNTDWLDISQFDDNGLPTPVLEATFSKCFINYCHRLYRGILYRCPHQYAGIQLGRLKRVSGQCVDIRPLDPPALAEALEHFENLTVLDSCRHCSMAVGPKRVPAGRQVADTAKAQ